MGDILKYFDSFVKCVVLLLILLIPPSSAANNTTIITPQTKVQCHMCVTNCDTENNRVTRAVLCTPVPPTHPIGVGCIIAEYWDETATHLIWTDQRCLMTEDIIGKWSLRRIVSSVWGLNLTRTSVDPGESYERSARLHHLGNTCEYFKNLRNGETVEKCFCATSLCNKDVTSAGGVGKAKYASGSKLSKSWTAFFLGNVILWIAR